MSHHGMQSSLTCLPVLTTRQQCLFLWAIFFRRMCMRICYVPFCATQYHSCRTIQVFEITYQENWTGHFVLVYAHNGCHDWMAFLVSLLKTKRSLLNVNLWTASSIQKCWLTENCRLNLTEFCRIWLKWSTTFKYMPLTHVCLCSSVRSYM